MDINEFVKKAEQIGLFDSSNNDKKDVYDEYGNYKVDQRKKEPSTILSSTSFQFFK